MRVTAAVISSEVLRVSAPKGRIVVIGGANLDIFGFSAGPVVMSDSNPGRITDSPGGVARNIAENLARLGVPTNLITAFGSDANGLRLAEACRADGIAIDASLVVEHVPGSRYLAILDHEGGLVVAVADMRALESLTPAFLAERSELLDSAELLVADTNMPAESLSWLASESSVPLLLDPVSAGKARRATAALPNVHTLKLNTLEAGALLGRVVNRDSETDVERAARDLRSQGARRVFITLGRRGVFALDETDTVRLASPAVHVANATGAGDAFTAGVAHAMIAGMTLLETAAFGSAMAAAALASTRTVSESIDLSEIQWATKEMLA